MVMAFINLGRNGMYCTTGLRINGERVVTKEMIAD